MLSPYREWIKSIRKKNEFLKNMSKNNIKIKKKFVHVFKVSAKKGPLRDATWPPKKSF